MERDWRSNSPLQHCLSCRPARNMGGRGCGTDDENDGRERRKRDVLFKKKEEEDRRLMRDEVPAAAEVFSRC